MKFSGWSARVLTQSSSTYFYIVLDYSRRALLFFCIESRMIEIRVDVLIRYRRLGLVFWPIFESLLSVLWTKTYLGCWGCSVHWKFQRRSSLLVLCANIWWVRRSGGAAFNGVGFRTDFCCLSSMSRWVIRCIFWIRFSNKEIVSHCVRL